MIDYERLEAAVARGHQEYVTADPFPHIAMPDFLPEASLRRVIDDFPTPEAISDWRRADALDDAGRIAQVKKLGYSNVLKLAPSLRALIAELNSAPFLIHLSKLTGIHHLLPDPMLSGGGIHQYLPGAVLRVHADFNRLGGYELDRRLNLLLYLNESWQPEWGGDLELWDRDMRRCVRKIAPRSNTCVVFSTTSDSYHGMPDPLTCPEGVTRKSLALYYYTNGRPDHERTPRHSTLWQERPDEVAS
ncbi:2OG-Fe(II) oxygenase [Frateuria sp. YIM B11624]|uniref:2OG-Fe(II) oxygenase n=1 Tax=Frateuria sp. YIM B11624 TaxID=3143185 RepID=UPI003C72BE9A